MARAMHSRCCWPRQRVAVLAQHVLHFLPQTGAVQRTFDLHVLFSLRQRAHEPEAERNVLVDRHGQRRRLLEHHADPHPEHVHVQRPVEDVAPVHDDFSRGPLARVHLIDAVEHAQQCRLAAARGPHQRGDRMVVDRHVDAEQRLLGAIEEIETADSDLLHPVVLGEAKRSGVFEGDGDYGRQIRTRPGVQRNIPPARFEHLPTVGHARLHRCSSAFKARAVRSQ